MKKKLSIQDVIDGAEMEDLAYFLVNHSDYRDIEDDTLREMAERFVLAYNEIQKYLDEYADSGEDYAAEDE